MPAYLSELIIGICTFLFSFYVPAIIFHSPPISHEPWVMLLHKAKLQLQLPYNLNLNIFFLGRVFEEEKQKKKQNKFYCQKTIFLCLLNFAVFCSPFRWIRQKCSFTNILWSFISLFPFSFNFYQLMALLLQCSEKGTIMHTVDKKINKK